MSAIGPVSVDMYLPGFAAIAADLGTDISHVALSLTSFFIGIAIGQMASGPVMDRYGRKKPLIAGLVLYVATALGCAFSPSIQFLIALRFLNAIGASVCMASARAVVRDLFSGIEIARVLSLLLMVYGIAPVIAPTIGGMVVAAFGWRAIFHICAALAALTLVTVILFLPESKGPDAAISLRPRKVLRQYVSLFKEPAFLTYALANTAATAGFFCYITGSPFVYMKLLDFTETQFGWIYGANVIGLIAANQVNRILLKRRGSAEILTLATSVSLGMITLLLVATLMGFTGRLWMPGMIFCFLFCFGFINANAMALALQPFTRNAGSAAALMGSMQMVAGASGSAMVSYLHSGTAIPMLSVMAGSIAISLVVLACAPLLLKNALATPTR